MSIGNVLESVNLGTLIEFKVDTWKKCFAYTVTFST